MISNNNSAEKKLRNIFEPFFEWLYVNINIVNKTIFYASSFSIFLCALQKMAACQTPDLYLKMMKNDACKDQKSSKK